MQIAEILKNIKKETLIIGGILLLLIILRVPSLFEPHWYTDEGFYASVANSFHYGKILYKDIWTSEMPGIFFIYYATGFAGNLSLVLTKILGLLSSIGTVILVYQISRKLFTHKVASTSALLAAILFGLPIFDANISTFENFFIFFSSLGIYLITKNTPRWMFLSGIFFGAALVFSLKPVFIILAVFLYLIAVFQKREIKIGSLALLSLGILLPLLALSLYFASKDALPEFTSSVFNQSLEEILNSSNDSLGFVILPNTIWTRTILLLVLAFIKIRLFVDKKISEAYLLLSFWLIFSVFSALIDQKPYLHYLVQVLPPLVIVTSLVIRKAFAQRQYLEKLKNLSIYLLSSLFCLNLFTSGQKLKMSLDPIGYYANFIKYAAGKVDTISYIKYFDSEAYKTYRLNSYLAQTLKEAPNIYIWTDNPWIYQLANINPPVKHIQSFKAKENMGEIKSSLVKNSPALIIIDQQAQDPNELIKFLEEHNYTFEKEFEGYNFYRKNKEN
ncbi:glycosyltransferase family 39 protein [Candidatus Dojkabacteria bacterium]|nr:glycosyltransferase family 39 protein [Candidatus Dojkabacteria bacterium]